MTPSLHSSRWYLLFSRAMVILTPVINDACDLQNQEIEPFFVEACKKYLRNHALKPGRISNVAQKYYILHHGGHQKCKLDFAEYVVGRFTSGAYFKKPTHMK